MAMKKMNPFMGKESKKEEKKEKKTSPAKYRFGEKAEGEKMPFKKGGMVKGKKGGC